MAMTITEKILARAAGRSEVAAGENIWVNIDTLMTHDVCGPGTIGIFRDRFGQDAKVFDNTKIVMLPDHYIFTKDEHAMRNLDILRAFAREQSIGKFHDAFSDSYAGVCHVALAQEGYNCPGSVLLGTDSHTCTSGAFGMFASGIGNTDAAFVMGTGKLWLKVPESMKFVFKGKLPAHVMAKDIILRVIGDIGVDGASYRAMEFCGEGISALSMEERMTVCNMAIEAGGKNGIIEADDVTREYLAQNGGAEGTTFKSDADAKYFSVKEYDAAELKAMVALPHSPDNKANAEDLGDQKVDRSYIGSCTGGKLTDFMAAARVLNGRKVSIETFIVPATRKVEAALNSEKIDGKSLMDIFKNAGCKIGPPSCAACLGGPKDTFGRTHGSERVISTTNRNFPARMGSKDSSVYLASPLTAAATAIKGSICDAREFI